MMAEAARAKSALRRWAESKPSGQASKRSLADQVYDDLGSDFPPASRAWVKDASWKGPVDVPLDQVDFSSAPNWTASREPEKMARFQKDMADGWRKPIVLVRTPGGGPATVVDGHHRALASKRLGKPVRAYVADVPSREGPWARMHAAQYHALSGSLRSTKA